MLPYFTRLRLAFRTFFGVLDYGRIPDEVTAALDVPAAAPREIPPPVPVAAPPTTPAPAAAAPAPPTEFAAHEDSSARAAQLLAILQRDSRLVDFLMEEIGPYDDAQIGAAVRDVHASARVALGRYLTLEPVLDADEGATVTVAAGTDAATVKVIGNVAGAPPFRGVLRHRGWRVRRIELPPLPPSDSLVIAPAEVEVP